MPKSKNKPSPQEAEQILEKWLTEGVTRDNIDSKKFDELLYHYPSKVLSYVERLNDL